MKESLVTALLKFIDNDLFPTLKELPAEAGSNGSGILLRRVFEDSYNYMKNGTLIRQVVNKINEIDFNRTEDRHLFGEIYEKILKDLQSAGNAGEYYTPRAVTQFMVDQVNPKLGESIPRPGLRYWRIPCMCHREYPEVQSRRSRTKTYSRVQSTESRRNRCRICSVSRT